MATSSGRRLHSGDGEASFTFEFEGRAVSAREGETVAAALLAAGELRLRVAEDGTPRGMLCGIGVCWECRCIIDGAANTRACMTEARPDMRVERQHGVGR